MNYSVYEGDFIIFTYDGGSQPGEVRTVLVLGGCTNSFIKAWDFVRKELRTFTRSKMVGTSFLPDSHFKMVDTTTLPRGWQDTKSIAKSFELDDWATYVSGSIVYAVKAVKPIDPNLIGSRLAASVGFTTPNGRVVRLNINVGKNVSLVVDNKTITHNATLADLVAAINS